MYNRKGNIIILLFVSDKILIIMYFVHYLQFTSYQKYMFEAVQYPQCAISVNFVITIDLHFFSTLTLTPNCTMSLDLSSTGSLSSPEALKRFSLTNVPLLLLVSFM